MLLAALSLEALRHARWAIIKSVRAGLYMCQQGRGYVQRGRSGLDNNGYNVDKRVSSRYIKHLAWCIMGNASGLLSLPDAQVEDADAAYMIFLFLCFSI